MVIGGMPRSGTTLLRRLCNEHPQMRVTNEFGNYAFIDEPLPLYLAHAAKRVVQINGRSRIIGQYGRRRKNYAGNVGAAIAHVVRLTMNGSTRVTLAALVAEARRSDSEARVVGDKLPQYIFMMDRFAELPDLLRLVIYRDCRDVTSSFLRQVRTDWKHRPWIRKMNTSEKVAHKWVSAIEMMERHADRMLVIRYEDLVSDPQSELQRLAKWLDVDPLGFNARIVSDTSVGKHKQGLTAQELDGVLRVAGPTLERLKYSLD